MTVFSEFKKKHGFDLAADKVALQRVREASESAKHDLSTRESVEINLPYIATIGGKPVVCRPENQYHLRVF